MSNLTYIYKKENEKIKLLDSLNYTLEEFKNNPTGCYPDWNTSSMTASESKYEYPIIDETTQELRDMTREEKILQLGMEELLQDGEYIENGKIIKVEYDESLGYLRKKWNKEKHIWEEEATEEERKEKYFSLINGYKSEILETGYTYTDENEKIHQQKCRDKDLALLGNAIAANEDMALYSKTLNTIWSFNDGDILEMSLEELKKLRLMGAVFVQAVFTAEAFFKAQNSNILFKKEEFINKINELSDVKCYKEAEK